MDLKIKIFLLISIYCNINADSVNTIESANQISYPELTGQRLDSNNGQDRVPLYSPSNCKPNQYLYPGNQKDDWICDCQIGFLYYPAKSFCYPAYRQGPCEKGYYLILPEQSVIPICSENTCEDGFARYNGKCYQLGKPNGPCRPELEGGGIFGVNATTWKLECLIGTDIMSLLYEKFFNKTQPRTP